MQVATLTTKLLECVTETNATMEAMANQAHANQEMANKNHQQAQASTDLLCQLRI